MAAIFNFVRTSKKKQRQKKSSDKTISQRSAVWLLETFDQFLFASCHHHVVKLLFFIESVCMQITTMILIYKEIFRKVLKLFSTQFATTIS